MATITPDTPLEHAGKFASDLLFDATAEADYIFSGLLTQLRDMLPLAIPETGDDPNVMLYGIQAQVMRLKAINSVCLSMFAGADLTIKQAIHAVRGPNGWEDLQPVLAAEHAPKPADPAANLALHPTAPPAEAILYEHHDGRRKVARSPEEAEFTRGEPGWYRAGPVDVSELGRA